MAASAKRTFDASTFPCELASVVRVLPRLLFGYMRPQLSPALREKVMLAVTTVNDCRYCSWVHRRAASAHGVDLAELAELLADTELAVRGDREALAVYYALHYAQTRGRPDPQLTERLLLTFGDRAGQELLAYIRGISFANLSGNTLDALLAGIGARRR